MARGKKAFLDRVYDKYVSADWFLGKADLNPLREMDLLNLEDFDEDLNELRQAIAKQVEQTKKFLEKQGVKPIDLEDTENSIENTSYNAGGSGSQKSLASDKKYQAQVGSSKGTLFNTNYHTVNVGGNTPSSNPDPRLYEIDDIILTFAPIIGSQDSEEEDPEDQKIPYYDLGSLPLGPLCTSGFDTNVIEQAAGRNSAGGNSASTVGEGDGAGSDYLNSLLTAQAQYEAQAQQFLSLLDSQKQESEASLEECAFSTLGILKIIAILIQIINVIKTIISYVLGIIVPIMEIVTLAAGLWVAPAGAGEIINKLMQTAVSILTKTMCSIIASLWKMINTNCLVKSSLDSLNSIQASLGIGLKALSETGSAFSMLGDIAKVIQQFKDQILEIDDNIDSVRDQLKEESKEVWSEIGSKSVDELKNGGLQVVQTALGPIQEQIEKYEQIRDAISGAVNEFKNTWGGLSSQVKAMGKAFKAQSDIK